MSIFGKTLTLKPVVVEPEPLKSREELLDLIAELIHQKSVAKGTPKAKELGQRLAALQEQVRAVNKITGRRCREDRFFFGAAKSLLPTETYAAIWDEAKRRYAEHIENKKNDLIPAADQSTLPK